MQSDRLHMCCSMSGKGSSRSLLIRKIPQIQLNESFPKKK